MPLSSCSSVITSTTVSLDWSSRPSTGRRSTGSIGAAALSGSSTSTFFWIEWISPSRMSSGGMVFSAISRSAITGFLSFSLSMVICEPLAIDLARCAASSTSSKRFATLSTQSSTVTRAMR